MNNNTRQFLRAILMRSSLCVCLGFSQISSASELQNDDAAVVGEFKKELKMELLTSINKGGAVNAISVCAEKAPLIASRLSRTHGVKLQRVSNRVRNPLNTPSESQSEILDYFAKNPDETSVFLDDSGNGVSVYAEPIRVDGLCLLCHGSNVSEKVFEKLAMEYPFDQATGYEAGDLRGIFSVEREPTNAN